MGSESHLTPRITEDLRPDPVGGSEDYGYVAEGPVSYVAIGSEDGVLGYLWASDAEDAAGFEPRGEAGDVAFNAAVAWAQALRERRAKGLSPSRALGELVEEAGDDAIGRAVPGTRAEATLKALREAP
ncbi:MULTISPECIES: hypothetical protein [unclassified Streptomyces]|uniref:hypothetical protein n=1 Tax=unclassified Streptomyces TaxID=2593676 RepID=UPI0022B6FAC3|nr:MULTISPECIES: hypothetical protein [unclassified Streptomyces]MCZ7417101.1 hypothetical protein [Streptomyces sp. WMMC897]MCZ7433071.1 hypothetical protein [Streptomyces sp. WMMC1477]